MIDLSIRLYLIGASIGRGWNVQDLPARTGNPEYSLKFFGGGSKFDKIKVIERIIDEEEKPDAVIIKECAAYFPGDIGSYKQLMTGWVERLRKMDIVPILATVIPVTKSHQMKLVMYNIVRRRKDINIKNNMFSRTRNESILKFNDWLRDFSKAEKVHLLDFQHLLENENNYLKSVFSRIDGLHLNSSGYERLDSFMVKELKKIKMKVQG